MKRIESQTLSINAPIDHIFDFLSNFNHFEHLMPEQVSDWQSSPDNCSFSVQGISIGMRIVKKEVPNTIFIVAEDPSPIKFEMVSHLEAKGSYETSVRLHIDADVNPFLSMVVSSPLENLLNMMVNKLKAYMDSRPQAI